MPDCHSQSSLIREQFFKSAPDSPHKKRKLSDPGGDELASTAQQNVSAAIETSFFDSPDDDVEKRDATPPRAMSHEPRGSQPDPVVSALAAKPASTAGPRSVPIFSPIPRPNDKPKRKTKVQAGGERHDCPICGATLETDNDGLNAHVDYCLSRAAIKELAHTPDPLQEVKGPFVGRKKLGEQRAKTAPLFNMSGRRKAR